MYDLFFLCHDMNYLTLVLWAERDFNRKSHDFGVLRFIVEGSAPHKPVRPLNAITKKERL